MSSISTQAPSGICATPNALRAFDAFRRRPVRNIAAIAATTGARLPTVSRAVESLVELGIVREITGRKRERAYCYGRYLEILNGGTVRAE